jgi:hypothetical protein
MNGVSCTDGRGIETKAKEETTSRLPKETERFESFSGLACSLYL